MMPESEIQALVRLLDDEDKEVLQHVYNKIRSLGPEVIPILENAWTEGLNPLQYERLEGLIHDIQFGSVCEELRSWLAGDQNLLRGYFAISRYFHPDLNFEETDKQIFKIRQSVWLELNDNQTPLEQIQIFNQVFYGFHGFSGVQLSEKTEHYCINQVLQSKHGASVALGLIYQIIARDLNLPVYGVPLLKYYVLAFCKRTITEFNTGENLEREVMFYINPVNRGSLFSRNEIKDYLQKMSVDSNAKYFVPAGNKVLLAELLDYLTELFKLKKDKTKLADLKLMLDIISA